MNPNLEWLASFLKNKLGHRDICRGKDVKTGRRMPSTSQGKRPAIQSSLPAPERTTVPTSSSDTSSLPNCETTSFCWLSHSFRFCFSGEHRIIHGESWGFTSSRQWKKSQPHQLVWTGSGGKVWSGSRSAAHHVPYVRSLIIQHYLTNHRCFQMGMISSILMI